MTFLDHIGLAGEFVPCDNNLPYINRNFQIIDSILQMSAVAFVDGVPVSPQEGEVYIIENPYYSYGSADSVIGIYNGSSWIFVNPKSGFRSWVESEKSFYWFDGESWIQEHMTDGDVKGPESSLRNSIARFDGETGKFITDSGVIIDDDNVITGAKAIYTDTIIANSIYTDVLGGENSIIVEDPAKTITLTSIFGTILTSISEIDSIQIADNIGKSYIFSVENKSGSQIIIKNNSSIVTGTGKDFQFKDGTSIIVIYSAETDTFNIVSGGGGTGSGLIVADITERDAIPSEDRTQGMTVTVLDDGTGAQVDYWLVGGITNGDWQEKVSKLAVITPSALGLSWTVSGVPSKDSALVLSVNPIYNLVASTTTPFGSAARPNSFTLTLINNDAGDKPITITASDTDGGLLGDSVTLGYRGATAQLMHIHTINRYVLIGRSN